MGKRKENFSVSFHISTLPPKPSYTYSASWSLDDENQQISGMVASMAEAVERVEAFFKSCPVTLPSF